MLFSSAIMGDLADLIFHSGHPGPPQPPPMTARKLRFRTQSCTILAGFGLLRPPQGSVKLISSKPTNLVSFDYHHTFPFCVCDVIAPITKGL